jgi:hypothetical protein
MLRSKKYFGKGYAHPSDRFTALQSPQELMQSYIRAYDNPSGDGGGDGGAGGGNDKKFTQEDIDKAIKESNSRLLADVDAQTQRKVNEALEKQKKDLNLSEDAVERLKKFEADEARREQELLKKNEEWEKLEQNMKEAHARELADAVKTGENWKGKYLDKCVEVEIHNAAGKAKVIGENLDMFTGHLKPQIRFDPDTSAYKVVDAQGNELRNEETMKPWTVEEYVLAEAQKRPGMIGGSTQQGGGSGKGGGGGQGNLNPGDLPSPEQIQDAFENDRPKYDEWSKQGIVQQVAEANAQ